MAKMKMVKANRIPICRLIEENIESQVAAMMQAEILKKLKEQTELLKQKVAPDIIKQQNEISQELMWLAEHIRRINYLSNKLLKKFDVRGRRGKG